MGEVAGRAWVVVVSRPAQEIIAKQQLDQQGAAVFGDGFETYLPLKLYQDPKREGVTLSRPFLPNYLFARLSPHVADWRGLFSTRGVKGVLGFSGSRMRGVKDELVVKIREREEQGFTRLGLAEDLPPGKVFERGQAVKVDRLVDAMVLEMVDARRALILYSLFNGSDSRQVMDLKRLSEVGATV